jgi:hypothetical protein
MANAFLTIDMIAREALALLQSNLVGARLFSRRYEAEFTGREKVGDTVRIRRRSEGVVDEYGGSTVTVRDIKETPTSLTLEKHFDATIRMSSKQLTLDIASFSDQVLAPRMIEMAEKIDTYALTKLLKVPGVAGNNGLLPTTVPTNLPNSIGEMAMVEKSLNDLKVPMNPRYGIMSTEWKATILSVDSFVEVDKSGVDSALRMAEVGPIMGIRGFMGQNVPTSTHTAGTQTAAVVNGSGSPLAAGVTSIPYDGGSVAAGTIKENDIVHIAGYGYVVAAALTTASSGAGTLTIDEPLREDVADDSVMTVYDGNAGTRQLHGAVFHPDAFALAVVPLELPMSANAAEFIRDERTGFAIRAVFDYDRDLKSDVLSLDVLCGARMVDGRMCQQIVKGV